MRRGAARSRRPSAPVGAPGASGAPGAPPARRRSRRIPRFTDWKTSRDALRLSIFSLTLVSISAIHVYLGPLAYARPTFLLLFLSVGVALMNPKALRVANLREAWPAWAVAGLLVLSLGSAVFGLSFGGSMRFIIEQYSKDLLIFFLTVAAIRDARDLSLLMWGFVAAIGVLLVLAATVLNLEPTSTGLGRMEGGATMFDANDLGMLFLMAIPMGILQFYNSGWKGKLFAAFVVIGSPAAIALTGSRGAMVGLAVVGTTLLLALSRIGVFKRLGVVVALLIALAVAAPEGYWDQMRTILNPSEDYNMSDEYGRIGIAKRGFGYMLRYPVFGVGIANFERAEGEISPIAQRLSHEGLAVRWIAPHNTYVQVGAELGVLGLATWLTLLCGGTIGLWRLRRTLPPSWDHESAQRRFLREACLFLPMSFLAFAVTSYFLSHAFSTPPYIFFTFLAGVVVLVRREKRIDRAHHRAARRAAAAAPAHRPPALAE